MKPAARRRPQFTHMGISHNPGHHLMMHGPLVHQISLLFETRPEENNEAPSSSCWGRARPRSYHPRMPRFCRASFRASPDIWKSRSPPHQIEFNLNLRPSNLEQTIWLFSAPSGDVVSTSGVSASSVPRFSVLGGVQGRFDCD